MPLNLNISATLNENLVINSSGGSITITQTTPTTITNLGGEEQIVDKQSVVTLSYMDVTKLVEFARAAGWRSERRTKGE